MPIKSDYVFTIINELWWIILQIYRWRFPSQNFPSTNTSCFYDAERTNNKGRHAVDLADLGPKANSY